MTALLAQHDVSLINSPVTGGFAWYAIQTKPRCEYKAEENLQRQGYKVFLPEHQREVIRRGKKALAKEPLFSRYIFIRLSLRDSNWAPLRSTRGVNKVVEFGQGPVAVPDDLVDNLFSPGNEPMVEARFQSGDEVIVTQGPFRNLRAIYQAPDGEQRAFVLLRILNDNRKLSFGLESLEPY